MPRTALELLRLLAQDAPAERIEEKAGRWPRPIRDAAAARELALRIRAGIDAHRRREAELSALVDTARDLASLPDPGDVLDAIVRRARTLLGTDVAYLTLHDPERGDTYMRATAGSVSARFQTLRLPAGRRARRAGRADPPARTGRADYPADERYRHTNEIDAAVDDEGLVAICGTPLLVDGEFVGVLFAANRSRRPFRHDEVALLGSLAALAAVSLVQSRRAAETAAALAALSTRARGHRAGRRGARPVRRGRARRRWRRRHRGGARRAAGLLGGGARRRRAAARAHGAAPAPAGPRTGRRTRRRSAEPAGIARRAGRAVACGRSPAAGQRLGTLVLGGRGGLDEGQGRTVERAAMVTALVLLFRLRAAEADHRVRTDLLADLLRRPDAARRPRARRARPAAGPAAARPARRRVCRGDEPARAALAACHAGDGRGLSGEHGDAVVALVPGRDPSAVATDVWPGGAR